MYLEIKPLDHYYLRLRDGSLAVVTGNWHTNYCALGYIKYRPSNEPTLWSKSGVFYERLVKTYGADKVREHTFWFTYIPFFDSRVPCIPLECVVELLDPLKRSVEVLSRVSDDLESVAVAILSDISANTNVVPGITGSMLPGIHNPNYSDVDFAIYGLKESIQVVEYINSNKLAYTPLSGEKLNTWARNIALSTGLTLKDAARFYRNWRRGVFRGKEYSFIYNDGTYRDVTLMPAFKRVGIAKIVADAYGGPSALNYPTQARVFSYKLIESSAKIPYEIDYILSYEAVYMAGLYEGNSFEVQGLVQCSDYLETCRIVLGVHEYRGFMRYCS